MKLSNAAIAIGLAIVTCSITPAPAAPESDAAQTASAQKAETVYRQAIEKRAADIVALLELKDPAKASKVHELLTGQYRALRDWHDANDPKLKGATGDQTRQINSSLEVLHNTFVSSLSAELTAEQLEKVKDKMTYNKVQVTYDAYCEIVPNLTQGQKEKILQLLKEARETAMDAGSAEAKSAIFRKYKGKINNYLSSEGHDLKQGNKDWGEKQKTKTARPATGPEK